MIRGTVNARLVAVVRLRVRGPGGAERDVDAVIDTGFTASLTLPAAAVAALGLVRQSGSAAAPATGRSGTSTSTPRRWSGTAPGAPCWRRPSATRSSLGCGCWLGMNCVSRSCRAARSRSARSLEEREAPPSRRTCSPGKARNGGPGSARRGGWKWVELSCLFSAHPCRSSGKPAQFRAADYARVHGEGGMAPSCDELMALVECQRQEMERLRARVDELTRALEAAQRQAKRQAAPFSKKAPKPNPRTPGRKAGDQHGSHGHRPPLADDQIDEHLDAPLPAACPHCHGAVVETHQDTQDQVELPGQAAASPHPHSRRPVPAVRSASARPSSLADRRRHRSRRQSSRSPGPGPGRLPQQARRTVPRQDGRRPHAPGHPADGGAAPPRSCCGPAADYGRFIRKSSGPCPTRNT